MFRLNRNRLKDDQKAPQAGDPGPLPPGGTGSQDSSFHRKVTFR